MTYCKYTNEKETKYKAKETRYKMVIYKRMTHKMKNLKKKHKDDKSQNFSANESFIFYFLYNQDVCS